MKESLNHVQQLLDHQLVDMAWSDNLIDCEESLLRASVTLSASAPAQIQELYALLLQDRDRLNTRFQELSVKSSLSEYVVNSRSLLDITTVHVATEAILRNEKPVQPKSDKASECFKMLFYFSQFLKPVFNILFYFSFSLEGAKREMVS